MFMTAITRTFMACTALLNSTTALAALFPRRVRHSGHSALVAALLAHRAPDTSSPRHL